jgi:hypothetical protein
MLQRLLRRHPAQKFTLPSIQFIQVKGKMSIPVLN